MSKFSKWLWTLFGLAYPWGILAPVWTKHTWIAVLLPFLSAGYGYTIYVVYSRRGEKELYGIVIALLVTFQICCSILSSLERGNIESVQKQVYILMAMILFYVALAVYRLRKKPADGEKGLHDGPAKAECVSQLP